MGRMREKLKETDKESLRGLLQKGCTDSDIEDYCHEYNLSPKSAFHFISVEEAPACCKKCKSVDFYASMYPCTSCVRAHQKDYWTPAEDVRQGAGNTAVSDKEGMKILSSVKPTANMCAICGEIWNELNLHSLKVGERSLLVCPECKEIFDRQYMLRVRSQG